MNPKVRGLQLENAVLEFLLLAVERGRGRQVDRGARVFVRALCDSGQW